MCQFSPVAGKQSLADFFSVEKDVYPVGRLDFDSEGLLILTNDTRLNHQLLNPAFGHEREYWVQVEGLPDTAALDRLQKSVPITIDGKIYHTQPCKAHLFANEPVVPARNPPIRFRRSIPTSWLSLTLTEGKNRQVRKMTAAIGFPTLRLIRWRIAGLCAEGLKPGEMLPIGQKELYAKLKIGL